MKKLYYIETAGYDMVVIYDPEFETIGSFDCFRDEDDNGETVFCFAADPGKKYKTPEEMMRAIEDDSAMELVKDFRRDRDGEYTDEEIPADEILDALLNSEASIIWGEIEKEI